MPERRDKIMHGFRYLISLVIVVFTAAIFLSSLGGCTAEKPAGEGFAIYLIGELNHPDEVPNIYDVVIGETPFIGLGDIVCYDSGTHELVLTGSAFACYQGVEGGFAVCVDRQPVYTGVFWNWFSSMSLNRIVILEKLSVDNNNIIVIQTGYPGEDFYQGDDPRDDKRIMNSLLEAGKIIELTTSEEKIPTPFKGWELYSFERDGEWHYTLIFGTNRMKWMDELIFEDDTPEENEVYHRIGTGEIISLLGRLMVDADIFWSTGIGINTATASGVALALPPDDIIEAISHYASEFGLDLHVYRVY
jgi:hypothetical protein